MSWTRRQALTSAVLAAVGAAGAAGMWRGARAGARQPVSDQRTPAPASQISRRIALVNVHTAERLEVEYRRGAAYDTAALSKLARLLRDFRTGEQHPIDPQLMDHLWTVAAKVGADASFSVISGYRSPATNAALHAHSTGVSQHSLHMQGRAIDVRLAGIDCADLAASAIDMRLGGVGYYRASDFVHLDTGAFRTWRG